MIQLAQLKMMKKTAYIVNTSVVKCSMRRIWPKLLTKGSSRERRWMFLMKNRRR